MLQKNTNRRLYIHMYSIDSIFGLNIGLNKFEYCPTKNKQM